MAKPKAELPPRDALIALIDGEGRLALRVSPGAKNDALLIEDGQLRARVSAPPEDGKANKAVLKLVSKALGIAAGRITLLRGAAARDKLLQVEL